MQPFTLRKSEVLPLKSEAAKSAVVDPISSHAPIHVKSTEGENDYQPREYSLSTSQEPFVTPPETLVTNDSAHLRMNKNDESLDYQSRVNNLLRAVKSVDIDKSGYIASDEALRLMRNYNTVYHLGMDDFEMMRIIQNSTHQGQVVVDSLCDSIRLEKSIRL